MGSILDRILGRGGVRPSRSPGAWTVADGARAAVFAYGTLQLDEVVEAVTGRRFVGVAATLAGYRRRRILERSYPGIVPVAGEITDGRLFRDVDPESLAWLDAFEGDLYDRLLLPVRTDAGETVQAFAYVVAARHRQRLSDHPWDVESFRLEHGEAFLAGCRRFRTEGVA